MKKCFLFLLIALGFASYSYAAPAKLTLLCDGVRPYGATLRMGSEWGNVAFMGDNYDTAQYAEPNGRLGLQCNEVGTAIECTGVWAFEHSPAKVVFSQDTDGKYSATFARSPYYGGAVVTVPCKVYTHE